MSLTLEQAAAFLHMHPETLRERVIAGLIPASKPGRRWVFLQQDIERYKRKLEGEETAEDLVRERLVPLHNGPAIYFLFVGHEIVYVGKTTQLARRLGDHAFRKSFDGFAYLPCGQKDLDRYERILIKHFQPRYNVRGRR